VHPQPQPIPEERLPHRNAGRFRPNYEAGPTVGTYWPLEPFSPYRQPWSGMYGGGYGYGAPVPHGLPYAPWAGGPGSWLAPSAQACARVTLRFEASAPITPFLFLPPVSPYDADELELLLDRQLSGGQPLVLQDARGAWVRVHPGARLERIGIGSCH
jgi:hypothetical protein